MSWQKTYAAFLFPYCDSARFPLPALGHKQPFSDKAGTDNLAALVFSAVLLINREPVSVLSDVLKKLFRF